VGLVGGITGFCEGRELIDNGLFVSSVPEVGDFLTKGRALWLEVADGVGVMELVCSRLPYIFASEVE